MIQILFEDGEALVIDKPGGLPIERPRKGGPSLEDHLDALKLGFQRPPVPVHRLDTDTSGCLLMARNPKALARVQSEVDSVLGRPMDTWTPEDMGRLDYLEACIHESMRLKPVGPFNVVEALKDTVEFQPVIEALIGQGADALNGQRCHPRLKLNQDAALGRVDDEQVLGRDGAPFGRRRLGGDRAGGSDKHRRKHGGDSDPEVHSNP